MPIAQPAQFGWMMAVQQATQAAANAAASAIGVAQVGELLTKRRTWQLQMLKVKNTFIDGFTMDPEDQQDQRTLVRTKSWPLQDMRSTSALDILQGGEESDDDGAQERDTSSAASWRLEASSRPVQLEVGWSPGSSSEESSAESSVASPTAGVDSAPLEGNTLDVEMSNGSELHGQGLCRPCAWFWRPEGCRNGASCYHCHLCPEDALKSKKKAKANARRSWRAAASKAHVRLPVLLGSASRPLPVGQVPKSDVSVTKAKSV